MSNFTYEIARGRELELRRLAREHRLASSAAPKRRLGARLLALLRRPVPQPQPTRATA
jgi:hypothetical protein